MRAGREHRVCARAGIDAVAGFCRAKVRSEPKRWRATGAACDAMFYAMDESCLVQNEAGRRAPPWRRFIALLACWRARMTERRLLAAFDERRLKDIGLTRLDVSRECAKPFWRA